MDYAIASPVAWTSCREARREIAMMRTRGKEIEDEIRQAIETKSALTGVPGVPDLTAGELATLDRIREIGGTVRHSFMSGWLGAVTGLRVTTVRRLAELGHLTAASEVVMRRTARSRSLPVHATSYTVVDPMRTRGPAS